MSRVVKLSVTVMETVRLLPPCRQASWMVYVGCISQGSRRMFPLPSCTHMEHWQLYRNQVALKLQQHNITKQIYRKAWCSCLGRNNTSDYGGSLFGRWFRASPSQQEWAHPFCHFLLFFCDLGFCFALFRIERKPNTGCLKGNKCANYNLLSYYNDNGSVNNEDGEKDGSI